MFLSLDRIRIETPGLYRWYRSVWVRLEELHEDRIAAAGAYEAYSRTWTSKGEHPTTSEESFSRLREAGFEAACLHLHLDRALFAARTS